MPEYHIHFNTACFGWQELACIADAIGNRHISGDGAFTEKCQELLKKELGISRALLTTACSHALKLATLVSGLQAGGKAIVPCLLQ